MTCFVPREVAKAHHPVFGVIFCVSLWIRRCCPEGCGVAWAGREPYTHLWTLTCLLRGAEGQEQILIFVFKVSVLFYSHTECGVKASVALGQVREVSQAWGIREWLLWQMKSPQSSLLLWSLHAGSISDLHFCTDMAIPSSFGTLKKYCAGKLGTGLVLVEYLLWILKIALNLGIADLVPYNYFPLSKKKKVWSGTVFWFSDFLYFCIKITSSLEDEHHKQSLFIQSPENFYFFTLSMILSFMEDAIPMNNPMC